MYLGTIWDSVSLESSLSAVALREVLLYWCLLFAMVNSEQYVAFVSVSWGIF